MESKDKGTSCLLGDGIREAISVRDPWEVRARQVVEPSEACWNHSFQGWALQKLSQRKREGEVEFPKMLENLGQEEDTAIYFSPHSPGLGRWEEKQAGPVGGSGG